MSANQNNKSREELAGFDNLPDSANVRIRIVMGLLSCSDATVWRISQS